jgi:hypothetical protein
MNLKVKGGSKMWAKYINVYKKTPKGREVMILLEKKDGKPTLYSIMYQERVIAEITEQQILDWICEKAIAEMSDELIDEINL